MTYPDEFKAKALGLLYELRVETETKLGNETIYTVEQLCKALGIAKKTLYIWEKELTEAYK